MVDFSMGTIYLMVGYMTSGHGPLHVLRTYQQRNTFDEAQTTPLRISNIGSAKIVVDCPDICTRDHRRRNEHEYPLAQFRLHH